MKSHQLRTTWRCSECDWMTKFIMDVWNHVCSDGHGTNHVANEASARVPVGTSPCSQGAFQAGPSDALQSPVNDAHVMKPAHVCSECGKGYASRKLLKRHEKLRHPRTDSESSEEDAHATKADNKAVGVERRAEARASDMSGDAVEAIVGVCFVGDSTGVGDDVDRTLPGEVLGSRATVGVCFDCGLCEEVFVSAVTRDEHVTAVHNSKQLSFSCDWCSIAVHDRSMLDDHRNACVNRPFLAAETPPIQLGVARSQATSSPAHADDVAPISLSSDDDVCDLPVIRSYVCHLCPKTCRGCRCLERHLHSVHGCVPLPGMLEDQDGLYMCEDCDFVSVSYMEMSEHRHTHSVKVFACDRCNAGFLTQEGLETHYQVRYSGSILGPLKPAGSIKRRNAKQTVIRPQNQYPCHLCDFVTNDGVVTVDHLAKMHSVDVRVGFDEVHGMLECRQCREKFKHQFEARSHQLRKHTGESGEYRCQHCPSVFFLPVALDRHVRAQHSQIQNASLSSLSTLGPAVFACHLCEDRFSDANSAGKHMFTRHGMNVFLPLHESGAGRFMCAVCGAACNNALSASAHRKTHPPPEFPCGLCELVFVVKTAAEAHQQRAHDGLASAEEKSVNETDDSSPSAAQTPSALHRDVIGGQVDAVQLTPMSGPVKRPLQTREEIAGRSAAKRPKADVCVLPPPQSQHGHPGSNQSAHGVTGCGLCGARFTNRLLFAAHKCKGAPHCSPSPESDSESGYG
jgi:hypothetical protein